MNRRHFIQLLGVSAMTAASPIVWADLKKDCPLLNFTVRTLDGDQEVNLCQAYGGKVVLIVNTASYCGFTPQFKGLEKLYAEYKNQGLVVLGFPSNDFYQDPKDEKQIKDFCELTYQVQFPMFGKSHVRGDDASPLFKALIQAAKGDAPAWNFHKYLIGRDGQLIGSYGSLTTPEALTPIIVKALADKN